MFFLGGGADRNHGGGGTDLSGGHDLGGSFGGGSGLGGGSGGGKADYISGSK